MRAPPALGVCSPALGPHSDRGPRGLARGVDTLVGLPGPRPGVGGQGDAAPPPASEAPREVPQGAGSPAPLRAHGTGGGWRGRRRCGGGSTYGGSQRRRPRTAPGPPVALLEPRGGGEVGAAGLGPVAPSVAGAAARPWGAQGAHQRAVAHPRGHGQGPVGVRGRGA